MPTIAPFDSVMAMLGLPLAFAATSFGLGLFIERLLGARLPNGLIIPLGLCGSIVLSLAVYSVGLGDVVAVALTATLAVAGLVFAVGGVRSRLNLGWAGLAGLATYLLFLAPELLTGHWTWSGYNFVNDTATQLLLSSYMKVHGTKAVGLLPPRSTGTEFIRTYLATGYPLGSQAELATLSGLLHTGPDVLYQGYISALAGTAAMSRAALMDRVAPPALAAGAGFVAASAALTYQYALQGNVKEIATVACAAAALAIAREVIVLGARLLPALVVSVPFAALFDSYNSAAVPFVGAIALAALVVWVLRSVRRPLARATRLSWRWAAPIVGVVLVAGVLAAPALSTVVSSYQSASSTFSAGGGGSSLNSLGQLARRLPLSEVSGVWLAGEYRYPITAHPANKLTALLTVLLFLLAGVGVLAALRSRDGPGWLILAMGLVMVVVLPRVSPYAGGKVLAIASPAVVLAALAGCAAVFALAGHLKRLARSALRTFAVVSAGAIALGVVASDVLAYHHDLVAPTRRMLAIEQVGEHLAGRGPVLFNEFEEYAKYFAFSARVNVPFETLTPRQAELVDPSASIYANYYDLDDERIAYVESFPYIVIRRSPAASRPPANYSLRYVNSYYEAWVRRPRPVVLRHLGLQGGFTAALPAGCSTVGRIVAGAPSKTSLVAAVHPFVALLDPHLARHTAAWPIDGTYADALTLATPGTLSGALALQRAGRYALWVQGSFPRAMRLRLNGRYVGQAQGVNTVKQWFSLGVFPLKAGAAQLIVERPGANFSPGNGGFAYLGPVALAEDQPERLQRLPLSRWRTLCGKPLDWIELVRG